MVGDRGPDGRWARPWLVLILLATQRETLQAYDPDGHGHPGRRGGAVVRRLPAGDPDRAVARGPPGAAM